MIVYDLTCEQGHAFEGWFGSSDDFSTQQAGGLLVCPQCGSPQVTKRPMAPAVPKKGNQAPSSLLSSEAEIEQSIQPAAGDGHVTSASQKADKGQGAPSAQTSVSQLPQPAMVNQPMPEELKKAIDKLAKVQTEALKDSKWVGGEFVEKSRAMHYGEADHEPIHGEASLDEAKGLMEEGVQLARLPFPVAPPDKLN